MRHAIATSTDPSVMMLVGKGSKRMVYIWGELISVIKHTERPHTGSLGWTLS